MSQVLHEAPVRGGSSIRYNVGLVALPLAMAFAIASGVPPPRPVCTALSWRGLWFLLLGGPRPQLAGPPGRSLLSSSAFLRNIAVAECPCCLLLPGCSFFVLLRRGL